MTCSCHKNMVLMDNIRAEKSEYRKFKVEILNYVKSLIGYFYINAQSVQSLQRNNASRAKLYINKKVPF